MQLQIDACFFNYAAIVPAAGMVPIVAQTAATSKLFSFEKPKHSRVWLACPLAISRRSRPVVIVCQRRPNLTCGNERRRHVCAVQGNPSSHVKLSRCGCRVHVPARYMRRPSLMAWCRIFLSPFRCGANGDFVQ